MLKPPGAGGCPPCPNPPCSGGPAGCDVKAKSISEVQINGKGDYSAPVGPVFSVGDQPPPGIVHPVSCVTWLQLYTPGVYNWSHWMILFNNPSELYITTSAL